MTKTIVFTGGGTAGHVSPNLALMPLLENTGAEVCYIGSINGIERDMVKDKGYTYYPISSGKLRRYFSMKNFTDPFRILAGYSQAKKILKRIKPACVFSKGGFVSVPVVYAASSLNIPVVIHECDCSIGLGNKLCIKKAKVVCVAYETTLSCVGGKGVHTGIPLRDSVFNGDKLRGLKFLGFDGNKNILLIMGGSSGAKAINEALEACLDKLTAIFDIAHIRGKNNLNPSLANNPSYVQFEFIGNELADIYAATDVMLSRAGANAVFEIAALKIPALLIPLPLCASRGDQILNAKYCEQKGYSHVLAQEDLSADTLYSSLLELINNRSSLKNAMEESCLANSAEKVAKIIMDNANE